MKIIAMTGMPFSGKSEAVKIAKEMQLPVIRMGDMVWNEVKSVGLELTDENVAYISNNMRKKFGKNIWARRTIEQIQTYNTTTMIIIDGVRSSEEIEYFRENIGKNFFLIAIVSSDDIRYKRAMMRGRVDDSKNIDKIKNRDQRELIWGLSEVIQSADFMIQNNQDLDSFRKKVKSVLEHIKNL